MVVVVAQGWRRRRAERGCKVNTRVERRADASRWPIVTCANAHGGDTALRGVGVAPCCRRDGIAAFLPSATVVPISESIETFGSNSYACFLTTMQFRFGLGLLITMFHSSNDSTRIGQVRFSKVHLTK